MRLGRCRWDGAPMRSFLAALLRLGRQPGGIPVGTVHQRRSGRSLLLVGCGLPPPSRWHRPSTQGPGGGPIEGTGGTPAVVRFGRLRPTTNIRCGCRSENSSRARVGSPASYVDRWRRVPHRRSRLHRDDLVRGVESWAPTAYAEPCGRRRRRQGRTVVPKSAREELGTHGPHSFRSGLKTMGGRQSLAIRRTVMPSLPSCFGAKIELCGAMSSPPSVPTVW